MKKNKNSLVLFFVSFAILSALTAGCASTPKAQRFPVYIETNAPPTNASPYKFSQEPAKRVIEDDGREYQNHIRELQRQRLAHERQLARIEQAAEEARLAKERGVTLHAPSQSQPQSAAPVQQQGSATFGVLPNGAPVLLPSQTLVPVVPVQQYYPYQERPFYGSTCNGAPVLLPSGGGGFGGGFNGFGNGFGSVPITEGTFRSTVRADWGSVRSGPLGKAFRFLTQSEDFLGYRHTGGPATVVRTQTVGAEVVGGGGFTSGPSFGWGR